MFQPEQLARKRNKWHPHWKGRSKVIPIPNNRGKTDEKKMKRNSGTCEIITKELKFMLSEF